MTFGTMVDRLNVNLDEAQVSGYWTTTHKKEALNKAILMVAGDVLYKTTSSTITLRPSKTRYHVPTDMLVPLRMKDSTTNGNNTRMFPTSVGQLEWDIPGWRKVASGPPRNWYFRGPHYVYLHYPPAVDLDGQTVTMEYVPVPTTYSSDATTVDMPNHAIEAVIDLAVAFLLLEKDPVEAIKKFTDYGERAMEAHAAVYNEQEMKTTKLRPADRFDKVHHSLRLSRKIYG